jgi:hypothetical protein
MRTGTGRKLVKEVVMKTVATGAVLLVGVAFLLGGCPLLLPSSPATLDPAEWGWVEANLEFVRAQALCRLGFPRDIEGFLACEAPARAEFEAVQRPERP